MKTKGDVDMRGNCVRPIVRAILAACVMIATAATVAAGGRSENGATAAEAPMAGVVSVDQVSPIRRDAGAPLRVVVTTSIVGDVVQAVAGDAAAVTVLMDVGQNPHSWEPTPRAYGHIEDAQIVFVNGFNLEETLMGDIEEIANGYVIEVSERITPRTGDDDHDHEADHDEDHHDDHDDDADHGHDEDHDDDHDDHDDDADHGHDEDHHDHGGVDPHVWLDPMNVISWTETIADALAAADPENAATYRGNAASYRDQLEALDREIRERVAAIAPERRKLVVDHAAIGYFADRYGFEEVGAVIPAFTDQAEPSAQAVADLVRLIQREEVAALFVGETAGRGLRDLVDAVAEEVGRDLRIGRLLTGSLAPRGQAGDTYIDFMRYNVDQIVAALAP